MGHALWCWSEGFLVLSAEDNELLTRTGASTPMGQYLRRYWLPVALSRELPEPDGVPLRVKIMGENLVAFRDSEGIVGLVDSRCPHRGADLYFGRNENCALRCVFHGWQFDRMGRAVELPNVPSDSHYHQTLRLKHYPTREYGEMIWAYMGPQDKPIPEVPNLEMGLVSPSNRFVTKKLQECNWAHSLEGGLDTTHFSFLHMPAPSVPSNVNSDAPADEKRLRWIREDPMPEFSLLDHEVGFVIGGARRADGQNRYWRTTQFAFPTHTTTPSTFQGETYFGTTWVPIDDDNCWIYTYAWNPDRALTEEELNKFKVGHGVMPEVDDKFIPLRRRSNEYLIDRTNQKNVTFTGVRGIAEQDAMIWDSQGRIHDRSLEHLCQTDAAIVRFRRVMLNHVKDLVEGKEPTAPFKPKSYKLRSGSWIAPEGTTFEQVMIERFGDRFGRVSDSNKTLT